MYKVSRIFSCLAIAWLVAGSLGATTLQPLSSLDLAEKADRIVVGECLEVESRWFDGTLVTLVTVGVAETLKGEAVEQLTLALPGGIDSRGEVPLAVTYAGAPMVTSGDEMLLFLGSVAGEVATFQVIGVSQGFFPVVRESGEALVVQDRGSRRGALPLDQVRSRIRSDLARLGAATKGGGR